MNLCLTQSSKASESKGEGSMDYERGRCKTEISSKGKQEIVCESSQVTKLIEDINETLCCTTLRVSNRFSGMQDFKYFRGNIQDAN